jgi:hypothetical protein
MRMVCNTLEKSPGLPRGPGRSLDSLRDPAAVCLCTVVRMRTHTSLQRSVGVLWINFGVKKLINVVCRIFWRIQVSPFLLLSEATQDRTGVSLGRVCSLLQNLL